MVSVIGPVQSRYIRVTHRPLVTKETITRPICASVRAVFVTNVISNITFHTSYAVGKILKC